ncbi:hypothetical protein DIPPA_16850 [Diplonema papillatum]|nr:hypothetical protein DIPPA_16850 [Diplonema papillatum]
MMAVAPMRGSQGVGHNHGMKPQGVSQLTALQRAKAAAVGRNDFFTAQAIQDEIEALKQGAITPQVMEMLYAAQDDAVGREDFSEATVIQQKIRNINRRRSSVASGDFSPRANSSLCDSVWQDSSRADTTTSTRQNSSRCSPTDTARLSNAIPSARSDKSLATPYTKSSARSSTASPVNTGRRASVPSLFNRRSSLASSKPLAATQRSQSPILRKPAVPTRKSLNLVPRTTTGFSSPPRAASNTRRGSAGGGGGGGGGGPPAAVRSATAVVSSPAHRRPAVGLAKRSSVHSPVIPRLALGGSNSSPQRPRQLPPPVPAATPAAAAAAVPARPAPPPAAPAAAAEAAPAPVSASLSELMATQRPRTAAAAPAPDASTASRRLNAAMNLAFITQADVLQTESLYFRVPVQLISRDPREGASLTSAASLSDMTRRRATCSPSYPPPIDENTPAKRQFSTGPTLAHPELIIRIRDQSQNFDDGRVDFIIHVIEARNLPPPHAGSVAKTHFAFQGTSATNEYETAPALVEEGTAIFDYKRRFAFKSMTQKLREWFRRPDMMIFDVLMTPHADQSSPRPGGILKVRRPFYTAPATPAARGYGDDDSEMASPGFNTTLRSDSSSPVRRARLAPHPALANAASPTSYSSEEPSMSDFSQSCRDGPYLSSSTSVRRGTMQTE